MVTKTTNTSKTTTTKKAKSKKVEVEPTTGIIAVDNGGHYTKVFSESMEEPISLSSRKAYGHDRLRTKSNYESGTYRLVYKDEIYFMGTLMEEGEGEMTSFTTTKTTDYFVLSVLQACALYGYDVNKVVTCTPFSRFTDSEEDGIVRALLGEHEIEINDVTYNFAIDDVVVTPEVTPAFFNEMPEGKVHCLDIGSRTIWYATTMFDGENFRIIEKETGTLERKGLDQYKPNNLKSYASMTANELLRHWNPTEPVVIFGGGVDFYPEIATELQAFFPELTVGDNPRFLQVKGMLEYGKLEYTPVEEEEEE